MIQPRPRDVVLPLASGSDIRLVPDTPIRFMNAVLGEEKPLWMETRSMTAGEL